MMKDENASSSARLDASSNVVMSGETIIHETQVEDA